MKKSIMQAAILAALGISATQASATGFVTLPTSGTSAYVQCRVAGNFGSQSDNTLPTTTTDNACAILDVASSPYNAVSTINSVPETGYSLVVGSAVTSSITAFSETVATLNERVFRNATTGECIYAKQVLMSSSTTHDYNPQLSGTQGLEVNDFAFGGYSGTVSAAYSKGNTSTLSSAYRIGRTFTSVQMQSASPFTSPATGYLVLPTAGGTAGTEINGVGQTLSPPGSPTAAQQQAPFSANWVDYTVDTSGVADEDGFPNINSPIMYIKQSCTSGSAPALANSFKIRQTGQESQPWVTITTSSRAPGTTLTP
ncbi:hypothetical protein LG204_13180 [Methylovorus menthalis]|uniref:hypothetical protein n=1 Tax=Methylovorus menthalis TaxID=1002227 RepID=UPI001E446705|nr:hypothetical protein [Methylovorus menthalis]MCB4812268.1 hypothetical protein [Methylovorus menthalis]